jgi:hypothetical protein
MRGTPPNHDLLQLPKAGRPELTGCNFRLSLGDLQKLLVKIERRASLEAGNSFGRPTPEWGGRRDRPVVPMFD